MRTIRLAVLALALALPLSACFDPPSPAPELGESVHELGTLSTTACALPSTAARNDANVPVAPGARIVTSTGTTYFFRWPANQDCTTPGRTCSMQIRNQAGIPIASGTLIVSAWGRYIFKLTAHQALQRVSFPDVAESQIVLGNQPDDDHVFYPAFAGIVAARSALTIPAQDAANIAAKRYPGGTFAPLVIVGDQQTALLSAAASASPKSLVPTHIVGGGVRLEYLDSIVAGGTMEYRTLFGFVRANAYRTPWQVALDNYRCALDIWQPTPAYSAAMRSSPGFIHSGIQDYLTTACWSDPDGDGQPVCPVCFDNDAWTGANPAQGDIADWVEGFGWIQIQGQFAPHWACCDPEVEECGCCADNVAWSGQPPPKMDPRYTSGSDERTNLRLWANGASSPRIGYYARPPNVYPASPDLDNSAQASYIVDWNAQNALDGADAFYVDVVGFGYSGSPTAVAGVLADPRFASDTVIEGFVDVYPAMGMLVGDLDFQGQAGSLSGGPGEESSETCSACLYPPMLRYLMGDRLGLLFKLDPTKEPFWQDDGDGYNDTDCDNADWGVRQAFLLGLKLGYWPDAGENYASSTVKQVNDLRASFWAQGPTYLHRYKLGGLSKDVDARTFRMSNGSYRVAVENCATSPQTITFNGVARTVPLGLSLQTF